MGSPSKKEKMVKKTDFEGDAFNFGHSSTNVCVERRRSSQKKLLTSSGSMNRARRLDVWLTWGEKLWKRRTRSCAWFPMGLWTSSSPFACISVWFEVPEFRNFRCGRRDLFEKLTSCRCLGVCASPPLALQDANGQPDISSRQSFKELFVQESGRRVTATRVSGLCRLSDLMVTLASWKSAGRKMKQNWANVSKW